MNEWTTEWPTESGKYWFYARIPGFDTSSRLVVVDVHQCIGGQMYISEGQFMYKEEGNEGHWKKIELPELPA